jgi:hypothetical protein
MTDITNPGDGAPETPEVGFEDSSTEGTKKPAEQHPTLAQALFAGLAKDMQPEIDAQIAALNKDLETTDRMLTSIKIWAMAFDELLKEIEEGRMESVDKALSSAEAGLASIADSCNDLLTEDQRGMIGGYLADAKNATSEVIREVEAFAEAYKQASLQVGEERAQKFAKENVLEKDSSFMVKVNRFMTEFKRCAADMVLSTLKKVLQEKRTELSQKISDLEGVTAQHPELDLNTIPTEPDSLEARESAFMGRFMRGRLGQTFNVLQNRRSEGDPSRAKINGAVARSFPAFANAATKLTLQDIRSEFDDDEYRNMVSGTFLPGKALHKLNQGEYYGANDSEVEILISQSATDDNEVLKVSAPEQMPEGKKLEGIKAAVNEGIQRSPAIIMAEILRLIENLTHVKTSIELLELHMGSYAQLLVIKEQLDSGCTFPEIEGMPFSKDLHRSEGALRVILKKDPKLFGYIQAILNKFDADTGAKAFKKDVLNWVFCIGARGGRGVPRTAQGIYYPSPETEEDTLQAYEQMAAELETQYALLPDPRENIDDPFYRLEALESTAITPERLLKDVAKLRAEALGIIREHVARINKDARKITELEGELKAKDEMLDRAGKREDAYSEGVRITGDFAGHLQRKFGGRAKLPRGAGKEIGDTIFATLKGQEVGLPENWPKTSHEVLPKEQ